MPQNHNKGFFKRCNPKVGGRYYNHRTWKVNIILGLNVLENIVQYKGQAMPHSQDVPLCERSMENCFQTQETITTEFRDLKSIWMNGN